MPINPPTGDDQRTVAPNTTRVEGVPNFPKLQAVQLFAGEAKKVRWVMKDQNGDPVDMSDIKTAGATVQARIKEAVNYASGMVPDATAIDGTFVDTGSTGEVDIQLTAEVVALPGISWMEIGISDSDGNIIFINQGYLCVNRSLWTPNNLVGFGSGPPTLAEIRLALRDSSPADNLWLGVEEFDLAEVIACIERPILYWNESPPPIPQKYNTASFPWRYYWLAGICGCLYKIAEAHYMRVHLSYQAGGVSVDDKNKFREYGAKGQQFWDEYKQWTQWKKVQLNCEAAVQSVGSQYYGWSWTQ